MVGWGLVGAGGGSRVSCMPHPPGTTSDRYMPTGPEHKRQNIDRAMKKRYMTLLFLLFLWEEAFFSGCTTFRKSIQEDRTVQHWEASAVTSTDSADLTSKISIEQGEITIDRYFIPLNPDGSTDTTRQSYREIVTIRKDITTKDTIQARTTQETVSTALQSDSTYIYRSEEKKSQHTRNFSFKLGFWLALILVGLLVILWRRLFR